MPTEHVDIIDSERHEPKGASAATDRQVLTSNGDGTTEFIKVDGADVTNAWRLGVSDYNDLATQTTPITLVSAGVNYELTNDGLGPFTNTTYKTTELGDLWDTGTNRFDFSNMSLGDSIDIRIDIEVTTTGANRVLDVDLELGVGGSPYTIPFVASSYVKTASVFRGVRWMSIYMGDTNTLNNPARILVRSDGAGDSVVVNGWYIRSAAKF